MTKVFGIHSEDFYDFIKKINEFYAKNKVFATQTHINENMGFYAVIYYESPPESKETPNKAKSQQPTAKQIEFLKKHNISIPKTKQETTELISQYIENQKRI